MTSNDMTYRNNDDSNNAINYKRMFLKLELFLTKYESFWQVDIHSAVRFVNLI